MYVCKFMIDKHFLPKKIQTEKKNGKLNFMPINNFCSSRDTQETNAEAHIWM